MRHREKIGLRRLQPSQAVKPNREVHDVHRLDGARFRAYSSETATTFQGRALDAPLKRRPSRVGAPLLYQRPVAALFLWRDHHGCGHAVAGFELQQAHALGGAAGFANGARIHADDFAVLADQHDF